MAHELDMSNGRANMAFVGPTPWHGLGEQLEPDAPLDIWRVEAGLDWHIKSAVVEYRNEVIGSREGDHLQGPNLQKFPEKRVLYRSDTGAGLAVVSEKYQVVQPEDVLEFYRDLIMTGGFAMNTAGSLFGGKKFWALAEIGKSAVIRGQDELRGFLLLSTACDGSMATIAQFTSVRVVCNNTLRFAVQSKDSTRPRLSIPHSTIFDGLRVKAELGLASTSWDKYIEEVKLLANRKMNRAEEVQWLIDVFGDSNLSIEDQPAAGAKLMKNVHALYMGAGKGSDLASSRGTMWGLVNAATEYYDFHTGHRTQDGRFDKAQFGETANMKQRAWDQALLMAA